MKSKEPGTIRQLFAFVGENNGKMLLSIFLLSWENCLA
mgnify:CR=1 FL=1